MITTRLFKKEIFIIFLAFVFFVFFFVSELIFVDAADIKEIIEGIRNNPSLLKNPEILNEALNYDPYSVFEILEQNPKVIDKIQEETKKILFDKFEEELKEFKRSTITDEKCIMGKYQNLTRKWLYYYGIITRASEICIKNFFISEKGDKNLILVFHNKKTLELFLGSVRGELYDDYFVTNKKTKIFEGTIFKKNDVLDLGVGNGEADISNSEEKINCYFSRLIFNQINLFCYINVSLEIFRDKNNVYLFASTKDKFDVNIDGGIKFISGNASIDVNNKDIILENDSRIEFDDFKIFTKNKLTISKNCENRENCIQANEESLDVVNVNNNEIKIVKSSEVPKSISIKLISGEVMFVEGDSTMIFSNKGINLKGYLTDFVSSVTFYKEFLPYYVIKNHKIYYCYEECKERGSIKKIMKSREEEILNKAFKFAYTAANDESYIGLGGAKGSMVYPDIYNELQKPTRLEEWKKTEINELENEKKELEKSEKLDPEEKEALIEMIEEKIEKIKKVREAYDCIGFVQASLKEAIQDTNWFKIYNPENIIAELKKKGNFKPVLIVWGKPFDNERYIHGRSGEIARLPKNLPKGTQILYFDNKNERDFFLSNVPKGAPFQNYGFYGSPVHSGVKGKGLTSIESHIGRHEISIDDITRYSDPLLTVLIDKPELNLDDVLRLAEK